MQVLRYTIQPTSPWITPLRSDTLHGLIACQIREWEGESSCLAFLERCKNEDAPFACSSALPAGKLPHPVLPPISRATYKHLYAKEKSSLFNVLQEYKAYRKTPHISCATWEKHKDALSLKALFDDFCSNGTEQKEIKDSADDKKSKGTEPHNSISRHTNGVIEGGLFFHHVDYSDKPLDIYVYASSNHEQSYFANYLKLIGELGFGADSSTGKGRFTCIGEPEDVTELFSGRGTHSMSLSLTSFRDYNNLEGYYKLITKRGRTWVGKSAISPFKRPFIALEEGAVLKGNTSVVLGNALCNIHADAHIVQLCHGLALPCTLLENDLCPQ